VVKRTLFNFGQPDPGDIEKTVKSRRSPYISINSEAHNFMFGFMLAPEHPYAVVVDEEGNFSIDNIPSGSYQLKAWHPMIGLQTTEVTVAAGVVVEFNFSFSTMKCTTSWDDFTNFKEHCRGRLGSLGLGYPNSRH